jgi:hypothetical protein
VNSQPIKITWRRPPLYKKQKDAIFNDSRYAFIEAGTKCGKTFGCIVWFLEQGLINGGEGKNFWWIAPVYPQAKIAYRRLKKYLSKYRDIYSVNESELSIKLINGSTLQFKSGEKPDNLYGDDVYAAVIDEASRMREESWNAVRSTLTATKGPLRAIGNVKGRTNWFYKLCRRAQSGEPNMAYSRITANDAVYAGILDAAEIEDARKMMPSSVFQELYLAEPSDDGGNPFVLDNIQKCISPLSDKPPIIYSVDVARKFDYTVIMGLDESGTVCFFDRFQAPWSKTIKKILEIVGNVRCIVDSTGVGDVVLDQLQTKSIFKNFEGFLYTGQSKQRLMERLSVSIEQQDVKFPEGVISDELKEFEYQYTRTGVIYSAPQGLHDDCVCALAQAVYATKDGSVTKRYEEFARNVKR